MSEGPIVGAVLCGGQSRRFGADKALADAGGRPLASIVIAALRGAGADPVLAIGGTAGPELGLPTVADRHPGAGPLAGLATALRWASSGLVVVVPCDLPLLTADHLRLLIDNASDSHAAVALRHGQPQPSVVCWPASHGQGVQALVDGGARAWRAALTAGPWVGVALPEAATADADTPAALASLLESAPTIPDA